MDPNSTPAGRKRTASRLKWLVKLARTRQRKVWGTFQRWYAGSESDGMPGWIIERLDGDEVHIHFEDFAAEAIEGTLREHGRRKGWTIRARTCKDSLVERHLLISYGGKPLLRMHTTSCSTPGLSYICVHFRPDNASLDLLVDLFRHHIDSEDIARYGRIYKAPRRRPAAT